MKNVSPYFILISLGKLILNDRQWKLVWQRFEINQSFNFTPGGNLLWQRIQMVSFYEERYQIEFEQFSCYKTSIVMFWGKIALPVRQLVPILSQRVSFAVERKNEDTVLNWEPVLARVHSMNVEHRNPGELSGSTGNNFEYASVSWSSSYSQR